MFVCGTSLKGIHIHFVYWLINFQFELFFFNCQENILLKLLIVREINFIDICSLLLFNLYRFLIIDNARKLISNRLRRHRKLTVPECIGKESLNRFWLQCKLGENSVQTAVDCFISRKLFGKFPALEICRIFCTLQEFWTSD